MMIKAEKQKYFLIIDKHFLNRRLDVQLEEVSGSERLCYGSKINVYTLKPTDQDVY